MSSVALAPAAASQQPQAHLLLGCLQSWHRRDVLLLLNRWQLLSQTRTTLLDIGHRPCHIRWAGLLRAANDMLQDAASGCRMLPHCSPGVQWPGAAGGRPPAPRLSGRLLQQWRLIPGLRQQCCPAAPAERPAHPASLPAAWQGQELSGLVVPCMTCCGQCFPCRQRDTEVLDRAWLDLIRGECSRCFPVTVIPPAALPDTQAWRPHSAQPPFIPVSLHQSRRSPPGAQPAALCTSAGCAGQPPPCPVPPPCGRAGHPDPAPGCQPDYLRRHPLTRAATPQDQPAHHCWQRDPAGCGSAAVGLPAHVTAHWRAVGGAQQVQTCAPVGQQPAERHAGHQGCWPAQE